VPEYYPQLYYYYLQLMLNNSARKEEFKIEYVSETMSRQTFHFLQQQIENYRYYYSCTAPTYYPVKSW
jgi:hypothetical protein